jgi:hypothetical protein
MKFEGTWVVELLVGNSFGVTLTFEPSAPQSKEGHLLSKTNALIKFEGPWIVGVLVGDCFGIPGQFDL